MCFGNVTALTTRHMQGSQQQEVKFQDPIFRKFQDNFRTFLLVYEAQDAKNAHFYVLMNVIH